MAKSVNGPVLLAAILSGLVIGFFAGAYALSAWAPAELVLRDAPPRMLAFDGVNAQYRDIYVVSLASRYATARDRQRALKEASDFIGITSGDVTVAQAVDMVNATRKIVVDENRSKGQASRFSPQDEAQLSTLSVDMERNVKDAVASTLLFSRPSDVNRLPQRVAGFVILLLLMGVAFVILRALGNRADRLAAASGDPMDPDPDADGGRDAPTLPEMDEIPAYDDDEPLEEPTLPSSPRGVSGAPGRPEAGVSPSAPAPTAGPAPAAAVASQPHRPAPIAGAPTARPLMSFPPTTYAFTVPNSETYEEDYQIAGTLGELLGECGINVVEPVGDTSPRRVPAFSVWVFDKQSFNNTTKVLVTEASGADPAWRARLASRGEPVVAREGAVVEINTATLRVEARISGLTLDSSGQYFETLTVTFSVQKR